MRIAQIRARQVLDSRGLPTVEVDVQLASGHLGRAMVPAGASTGAAEARELRDGAPRRWRGKGVERAVANVNQVIGPALAGADPADQAGLDQRLRELDGTPDKGRLGANAILGVSLAAARAAAAGRGLPLYRHLGAGTLLPVPMFNIISGGLHARGNLDLQDFLAIPWGAPDPAEALRWGTEIWYAMKDLLAARGHSTLVADEGGFGPSLGSNEEALELLVAAIGAAGLRPGPDVAIAVDVAASHFWRDGRYHLGAEGRSLTAAELVDLLERWVQGYPILSIEDGLAEEDWAGWRLLTARLGARVALVGDDLFTTNPQRLERGIAAGCANAVLVKPNQIGTLTETLAVVARARAAGYLPVISARSGETEDAFITDLAVATAAGQLKVGSLTRSERLAKWNQLLRIAEELGAAGTWPGKAVWGHLAAARRWG